MSLPSRRARFRAILRGSSCVFPASVHDPISARLAEEIGFEAGILAGSVASMSVLGAPDLILLTLSEFAETARRIARASALPLLVDADHGYGGALNAMRTVEELEAAGVAALTLEDTALPRPFGATGVEIVSRGEAAGKLRAALAARQDPDLCVIGRTSALQTDGLTEAIERIRAYQDIGVDGIFVTGVSDRNELEAIGRVAQAPVLLGAVAPALLDRDLLAAHGVRVALQGHQPFAAAVQAIAATLTALRAGAPLPDLASAQMLERLTQARLWRQRGEEFLN